MQNDMISSRGSNKRTDPLLSSASVDCVKDERVASFFGDKKSEARDSSELLLLLRPEVIESRFV